MDDPTNSSAENAAAYGQWFVEINQSPASDEPLFTNAEEMKRIYGLLDRYNGSAEVRNIAEEYLTPKSQATPMLTSLTPVIQPLIRPNRSLWRERQVAAWLLGIARLDKKQRQFAVESLSRLLDGKLNPDMSEVARTALWRSFIAALVLTLPVKGEFFDPNGPNVLETLTIIMCLTTPLWLFVSVIRTRVTSALIAAEAARSLGNLRAAESLDVLVAAAQTGRRRRGRLKRRVRQAALEALPAVVSTLNETHYGEIQSETMQGLCRLLQYCEENLAVVIINAFAVVGDSMALGLIEKLAASDGRAGFEPRVHRAALLALPQIQTRVARARDPHQLLRGAAMPMTPTEQLLRPSTETTVTDPLELLRASSDPNWKGTEREVGFVIRILQDLKEAGDTRALTYVERIAEAETNDARIRNAALECLPILRAHRELERYSPSQTEPQRNILGLGP